MTKDEEYTVMSLLERWAFGHPDKDRPFLVMMGRSFTPVEYYNHIRENSEFRNTLFNFLSEQSERAIEPDTPAQMIRRAIEANVL